MRNGKDLPEGKANEKRGAPSVIKEKPCNGEEKDTEKEVVLPDLFEKDNACMAHSDSGAEAVKEGGNQERSEE